MSADTGGIKHNVGKPQMDLLSPIALVETAKVLTFGADKYAAHNWRKGLSYSHLIAAIQRHLVALNAGIDLDSETGMHHAAHIMCEAMFLVEQYYTQHPMTDLDDRFKLSEEQKNLLEGMLAGTHQK